MKLKLTLTLSAVMLGMLSTQCFAQYWEDDVGGIFNPPPVEFNPIYYGYGSTGKKTYNKVDLQDGRLMEVDDGVAMYNNQGEIIWHTVGSAIGYYEGSRDGGIVAGAITKIQAGGKNYDMIYLWSVNVAEGGRASGWVKTSKLTPKSDIVDILNDQKDDLLALFEGEHEHNNYQGFETQEYFLPSYMEEYYLDPDRDASYTAGKAKYYYTRDNVNSGLMNIPETGSQRYGVAHDLAPIGATFYRDMNLSRVNVNIYPPSSSTALNHKLRLVWGYYQTSAGERIYSWVNERTLID